MRVRNVWNRTLVFGGKNIEPGKSKEMDEGVDIDYHLKSGHVKVENVKLHKLPKNIIRENDINKE